MKSRLGPVKRIGAVVLGILLLWGCAANEKRASQVAVLETLESQLYSPESAVAERAALALLSSRSERAFRTLKSALTEGNSSTARSAVLLAFIVQQDPRIRVEAADALGDINPRTVDLAKRYLTEVIGARAAGDLLSRARDDTRAVTERVAAIDVVADYGRKESVEGLIDLLEDRNGEIAEAAAAALRKVTYQPFSGDAELWRSWYRQNKGLSREQWREVGEFYYRQTGRLQEQIRALTDQSEALEKEVVALSKRVVDLSVNLKQPQYILAVLQSQLPVDAQIYAVSKLGVMKAQGAVEVLIEKALSDRPRLAAAAIRALGEIKTDNPQALVVVASRLKDGNPDVRGAAAKAYGQLPESDPKLLMPLFDDPSAEVRTAVAEAMGRHEWQPAFDRLVAALGDPSAEVRAAAARALGQLKDRRAVPELLKLVDDDSDTVVYATVYSLYQLPDTRAYDALIRATEHENPGVREGAVLALEKVLALNTRDARAAIDRFFELSRSDPVQKVADRAWKALVPLLGDDPGVIFDKVDRLMDSGRFERAETLLKKVADRPDAAEEVGEARRRLARAYLEQGNYRGALAYYRQVLEQSPGDSEAREGVEAALEALDDWKGLASLYARELASGNYGQGAQERFNVILDRLLETGEYRQAVAAADVVLSSPGEFQEEFRRRVEDVRARALGLLADKLIAALEDPDDAGQAAFDELGALGERAAPALVDALESPSETVRTRVLDLLCLLAGGMTFGFDPAADPAGQREAIEAWRAWLAAGASE